MTTRIVAALIAAMLLPACNPPQAEAPPPPRPQQAGQPMDPLRTTAHMAGARASALIGDQAGVQRNMQAMSEDLRRAMKLADASRPIDREAARSVARAMPGVRSVNWIDRHNLLVRVDGANLRSQQAIDDLCLELEPLGDTLAVVVHLQNAAALNHDEMDTLSRNCQLAPGDHALFQKNHELDALDPVVRAQHRATMKRMQDAPPAQKSAGDRAAVDAIVEM